MWSGVRGRSSVLQISSLRKTLHPNSAGIRHSGIIFFPPMEQPVSWKQLVADALRYLGGAASLKDITNAVGSNPARPDTKTWDATIRRVVRQYNIFEPFKTADGSAG